jgi:uncharacterized protein
LHIALPALGIEDGCLSIVGSLEEVRGFAFFPSSEDYERTADMADSAKPDQPVSAHRALYFTFESAEDVPATMRKEVAEHGWPIVGDDAYPFLQRKVEGRDEPVTEHELELASAIMRALSSLTARHPKAFEDYGEVEVRESFEENGIELALRIPHPRSEELQSEEPLPRAPTMDGSPNPYELPLEPRKLAQLQRALGDFTLHRALGLFCAVGSVPALPPPSAWIGEIMQHVKIADEAQARGVVELLMEVYHHVLSTLDDNGIDGLVPDAGDQAACREWSRGYATLLEELDPSQLEPGVLQAAFAIRALAEVPDMLKVVDDIRGTKSREAMLADYRESLADAAHHLFCAWEDARAEPPTGQRDEPFRREAPKVGRNDPCPCGSGKKYKKCCAKS